MRLDEVAETKHGGNQANDNKGCCGDSEADNPVDESGGGSGYFFGIARTKHVVPTSHNEIGKKEKTNNDEDKVDEVETAAG